MIHRQIVALAVLAGIDSKVLPIYVTGFFAAIGTGIIAPLLPELKSYFGVSYGEAGLMMSAFGLAKLLLDLPVSFLADRWNKMLLMLLGTLLIASGGVAGSLSDSFSILVVARGVMGAGASILMTTAVISISARATSENRGRMLGLFSAWNLLGISFGPSIGGYLAMLFDWRATFVFCALIALVSSTWIVLARKHLLPPAEAGRTENLGSGKSKGRERSSEPIGRSPVAFALWGIYLLAFVLLFSMAGFRQSQVSLYGSSVLGLDLATLGLVLSVSSLITAFVLFPSGFLSDKYGRLTILTPGIASLALGVLWVSFSSDLVQFMLAASLLGVCGVIPSVLTVIVADLSPPASASRNIGFVRFILDGGMFAGPVGLGILTDHLGFRTPGLLTFAGIVGTTALVLVFARVPRTAVEIGGGRIDRPRTM